MNNIRSLRIARNMTQAELARRVGVTQAQMSWIELKRRKLSLSLARKIANALRCKLDEIECA